jgi:alpha-galactosidase
VCEFRRTADETVERVTLEAGETEEAGAAPVFLRIEREESGTRITAELHSETPLEIIRLEVGRSFPPKRRRTVFMNGFQSWTTSREWRRGEHMRGLRPLFTPWIRKYRLRNYGDYHFTDYDQGNLIHGYTFAYLREASYLHLIGSLSERYGYTRLRWDWRRCRMSCELDCEGLRTEGGAVLLDLFETGGEEGIPFSRYFARMGVESAAPVRSGWTSWYYHYTDIDEDTVQANLHSFTKNDIPIDVFQIDDGWQRAVGDWLKENDSFPRGMKRTADRIVDAGYTPGLWLAPFIAEGVSELFQNHPDWFVHGDDGRPLVVGYNPFHWRGRFYALDIEIPQVREYLQRVFRRVIEEWGFRFLKLDFLYAAGMLPRNGKSRGQIMYEGMDLLRELAGDVPILGCGVPLGSAFGKVDYCRIGADVALRWEDRRLKLLGYRERVSTVNSLTSTRGRWPLNGRAFVNDPDVYILRSEGHELTEDQQFTLFLMNQIYGGLVLTSDDPSEYTGYQLERYLSQFPVKEKRILASSPLSTRFRVGEMEYIAFHNTSPEKRLVTLEQRLHFCAEEGFFFGERFTLLPYQSRCFLVVDNGPYAVAGSTGLLFPGSEVENFFFDQGTIRYEVNPQVRNPGLIYIKVPSFMRECEINGRLVRAEEKVDMNLLVVERAVR